MPSLAAFLFLVTAYYHQVLRISASTVTVDAVIEVTQTVTENVLPPPPPPPPPSPSPSTTTLTSDPVSASTTTVTPLAGTSAVRSSPPEVTFQRDAGVTTARSVHTVVSTAGRDPELVEPVAKSNQALTIPIHVVILVAAVVVAALALLILCLWYKRKRRCRRRRSSGLNEPGRPYSAQQQESSSPDPWQAQHDDPRWPESMSEKFFSDHLSWLQSSSQSLPGMKRETTVSTTLSSGGGQERSRQSTTSMSMFLDNSSHGLPQPDLVPQPLSDSEPAGDLSSRWTTSSCESQQARENPLDKHRQTPPVPIKAYIQPPRFDDADHWGDQIRSILHVRSVSPSVYSRDA